MSWTATARMQAGLITRRQLIAAGVPTGTIAAWLSRGRLEPTASAGVYRAAGAPDTAESAAWLAALSTRSVVSYLSAAAWWEQPVEGDGRVHVTRLDRKRLDWPKGVRVHRVGLDRSAIVKHRGLWVTTRSETALDCIGWLSPGRALGLADRALRQGWLSTEDINRRLTDSPGRWGNRQIRRLAAQLDRGADAESERRLHRLLRTAHVTGWVAQYPFRSTSGRFTIDVAFPAMRIAIEVDGYAYHSNEDRFQRDRTKQNALIAAGWRVLRFTWADIVDRPEFVLAQLGQVLAA